MNQEPATCEMSRKYQATHVGSLEGILDAEPVAIPGHFVGSADIAVGSPLLGLLENAEEGRGGGGARERSWVARSDKSSNAMAFYILTFVKRPARMETISVLKAKTLQ